MNAVFRVTAAPSVGKRGLFFAAWLGLMSLRAATYYVATNGADSNAGTSNAPFATPQKAVTLSALTAGDTIYVRGGTYALSAQVKPSRVGTAASYIKLWAYPGELPVFDFATMATTNKALDLRKDCWHVKGIEVKNCATESGIFIGGNGIIVEGCVVHDCANDGFILGSTSAKATNALILNCDSYRNFQPGSGGNNGDGFAAKAGCSTGNVFRGCRAWNNSDDGWDFYDNNNSVALQNCWSFANGLDLWNVGAGFTGNGNGFKLGGEGTTAEHRLTNCVAFGNKAKGFDHNNGNAGQTMVNCTSISNGGVNFSFFEVPTAGTLLRNVLINDVSFGGTLTNLAANSEMISNSWQLVTVTAADFASLNTSVATNARNADYSLPTNSLFRLAAGSQLIDRGRDVGLPFNGVRPDLGAFEFDAPVQTPTTLSPVGTGWTNGGFSLRASGFTGHGPAVLYASTNLQSWQPLYTNAPLTGDLLFLDTAATNLPQRFYRAGEE
jgi:hypothetical protein